MKSDDRLKFSTMIERRAVDEQISHMDAIIAHCEETGLEIEMVKGLVNQSLKQKIEHEARELRYLPGKGSHLDI
ncbi:MAG: late promoter transcription accessory protein [Candidatus Dormibacteria bacterium]